MANFHSDLWFDNKTTEHYKESLEYFKWNNIIGVFCQGSGNYGLDYKDSDFDSKLIVTPSFRDIVLNKKPVSTTHVRKNNEHIDFKDARLYAEMFRKHNLNFIEILFTPYFAINDQYYNEWNMLVENRELIAKANPYRAVKAMKGIALEKYHALEHRYPSKIDIIDKFGYDRKQLHHLIRVSYFLDGFMRGKKYADCMIPGETESKYLLKIKKDNSFYSLEEARELAAAVKTEIETRCDAFCAEIEDRQDPAADELLNEFLYEVIKKSIKFEIDEGVM